MRLAANGEAGEAAVRLAEFGHGHGDDLEPFVADAPRGGGAIVNVSSTAGIRASVATHYGASKGAVRLMSKSMAAMGAVDGIRCNSVHPGPVDTAMGRAALPEAVRAERLSRVPLGRFARAEEIAAAIAFLASDDASFVTGTELIVDGGATAV